MYTTAWCGYCTRAKTLLGRRGLDYEEIPLDGDPAFRARLLELTGRWTVPQILIDGRPDRRLRRALGARPTGRLPRASNPRPSGRYFGGEAARPGSARPIG